MIKEKYNKFKSLGQPEKTFVAIGLLPALVVVAGIFLILAPFLAVVAAIQFIEEDNDPVEPRRF